MAEAIADFLSRSATSKPPIPISAQVLGSGAGAEEDTARELEELEKVPPDLFT